MSEFRLDRTKFVAHSAGEASASHATYYKMLTWRERIRIAHYLNSIAYNFPIDSPPRLDRTKFSARSRNG
ncbi:MAG: hypothetical protein K0S09_443 [Sphingobacteriaceae bacterium]|jgi:hypothetical protein|nr:hypothetical protein [Sphingobacteriaceae bacterium]